MDYAKIASQVIENVGGKQNIKSVQHCATRLRLQLKNNDLRNEEAVSDIEGVAVFNLYELSEDIAFNVDEWSKIISDASAVIYQFPFYWMSAPSLLKKWQDEVFTHLSKTPAVAGKPLMIVTTTGSEYDAYRSGGRNRFTTDELLRPYQGSAIHSGMAWQTPIVVYGMGTADAGKNIAEGANSYKQRIEMLINSSNAGNNW
mgnify:FL=1